MSDYRDRDKHFLGQREEELVPKLALLAWAYLTWPKTQAPSSRLHRESGAREVSVVCRKQEGLQAKQDGSPPGSPVPGILQARTLEWVAISFSNAVKWKVKVKSLSRV